jgi:hypothetical protein
MLKHQSTEQISLFSKFSQLFSVSFAYTAMKIFGRIYFLKRVYLFFSRIGGQQIQISQDDHLSNTSVILLGGADVNDVVRDIKELGYSLKVRLNDSCLESIRQYSDNEKCYAYGDPKLGFFLSDKANCEEHIGKDILVARYYNFKDDDAFSDFVNSPVLEAIAKGYLGNTARNIATQLWWSFPADVDNATKSNAAHFFHRDVDAWAFVKFFFYLSDVGPGDGPHVYVEASHKPSAFRQLVTEKFRIKRHSDDTVRSRFSDSAVTPIFGSAGTGMVVDTFGFHKGESPETHPRLIMCAVYATEDYGVQDFVVNKHELKYYGS